MMKHNGVNKGNGPLMAAIWMRRRLVLSLLLCLVLALVAAVALRAYGPDSVQGLNLSAVASVASPTPALHDIYLLSLEELPHASVIAGKPVSLQWVHELTGQAPVATGPAQVSCSLALYGPYTSLANLDKAKVAGDGITPPGTDPAFTAPPLTVSDWDTMAQHTQVVLPTTLHAGYYLVVGQCVNTRDTRTSAAGFPIQIVALRS
jgi:hypothetical protein